MKFKKILCFVLSTFMLSNFFIPVHAGKPKITSKPTRKKMRNVHRFGMPSATPSPLVEIPKVPFGNNGREVPDDAKYRFLVVNPRFDCCDYIGYDDISPCFADKISEDSIYYRVSQKTKVYYQFWKKIELKFIELKKSLPAEEYLTRYRSWWSDMRPVVVSTFLASPPQINEAYTKARSYDDVVFGDMYQIKIIDHMLEEWTLGSKYFNMAVLAAESAVWQSLEYKLDEAIEVEVRYLREYGISPSNLV